MPLRTCIACQKKRAKRDLIRVVHTPEGRIEIDPKGKRAGRGAYLCAESGCWEWASRQGKLGYALKCPIGVDQMMELRAQVAPLLDRPVVGSPQTPTLDAESGEGAIGQTRDRSAAKGEA